MSVLTTKRIVTDSLGQDYQDLYFSEQSASVSLVEATGNWSNVISLPGLGFNSQQVVSLAIDQFVSNVILHIRVPSPIANQTLCRAWGYAILDSVQVTLGATASMVSQLSGDGILQTILAQCDNQERRDKILRLAGEEQLAPPVAPAGGYAPYMDAYITIPTPFSTMCSSGKIPLDTTILSNPIQLTFRFRTADSIYGGSGLRPTSMSVAECLVRQIKLSDQQDSIRTDMLAYPQLSYNYPWVYSQTYSPPQFTGVRPTDGGKCRVQLMGFPNADILGIAFWVVQTDYKSPTALSSPNPYCTDDISDISVTFNNIPLFNFPAKSWKLAGMIGNCDSTAFGTSLIAPGAGNNFASAPFESNLVFLDFSRLRGACYDDQHMWNTARLTNQVVEVSFNTMKSSATTYQLHATYFLNAIAEFQYGTSAIVM